MSTQGVTNPVLGVIGRMRLQLDSLERWASQSAVTVFKPIGNFAQIVERTAEEWGIPPYRITERLNSKISSEPRHVAMFLCWKHVENASFPMIGREFGGYHHTTVMAAVNKISDRISEDAKFAERVSRIEKRLELAL